MLTQTLLQRSFQFEVPEFENSLPASTESFDALVPWPWQFFEQVSMGVILLNMHAACRSKI
jgi:hypothetical protein